MLLLLLWFGDRRPGSGFVFVFVAVVVVPDDNRESNADDAFYFPVFQCFDFDFDFGFDSVAIQNARSVLVDYYSSMLCCVVLCCVVLGTRRTTIN